MSEVETIKIDPDGKYVICIEAKEDRLNPRHLGDVSETLHAWWESDLKFIIFDITNVKVRFEKVGGEDNV